MALALAVVLAACGSDQDPTLGGNQAPGTSVTTAAATTTTTGPRIFTGEATSGDGHRYRVTVEVGERLTAPQAAELCGANPGAGASSLAVTLTVANIGERTAPSPPLRLELVVAGGREPVQVRDAAGACTFTPRVSHIDPGASVVYRGSTPPIGADAAPGAAGRVEVSMSESRFTLVAPVP